MIKNAFRAIQSRQVNKTRRIQQEETFLWKKNLNFLKLRVKLFALVDDENVEIWLRANEAFVSAF